jgi:predicted 2-oxoglutarate/Fe(II)-dependent dioxygenase YbiX
MDGQPDLQQYVSSEDVAKDKDLYLEKNEKNEFITNYKGDFIYKRPYTGRKNYHNRYRKLSMTVTLSDPEQYEGGDFVIDRGPHYKGERYWVAEEIKTRGSVIVFPSFVPHRIEPIKSGVRYSLVMWSIGPKWA